MKNEVELAAEVENLLREGNWKYEKEVVLGDARPDFVVTTENGDHVVVEVKAWEPTVDNMARALHQAQRYKELSRAAAALVVTATGKAAPMESGGGVVSTAQFLASLASLALKAAQTKSKSPEPQSSRPSPKKIVFASMPFATQYDDTFLVAIEPAALTNGAIAERVDHSGMAGNVVSQIQMMIKAAKVVVADLSDSRPNVLHEVGFAEALGKPIIQICSTSMAALPFNVRNNQTVPYVIGQAVRLRKRLEVELQKII